MEEKQVNLNSEGNRWQRRKEQRPSEIIQAARVLFVSQGFAATKVADIAKLAGIQPGTLYVYFENKESLFKAVIEESIKPLLHYADNIIDNFTDSPQELIRTLVQRWWDLLESDTCRGIPKLLTSESQNFPELTAFYTRECIDPARNMIYRILEYALNKNEIRLLNMEMASRIIFLILHQLLLHAHSFAEHEPHPVSTKAMLNAAADFIIRSVLKTEAN
ncbi:MAG: TetR/AcrR family transcriptional regulator [Fibrobacteraceae bacterium]|nr:TetR/AcrR family transcriptional regulator [Fibrobacteraceae bacterium]